MENAFKEYSYKNIPVLFYDSCDSTNTRAKELARETPNMKKCILIAKEQTGGRGRLGKSFVSKRGGLYISFILRDIPKKADLLSVTTDTAVKICYTLEELTDLSPKIKWVNDVYVNGKKLSGILTEGAFKPNGEIDFLVIGIGINIADISACAEIADIATSLEKECGGKPPRIEDLIKALTHHIYSGECDLSKEYICRSIIVGKSLTVNDFKSTYNATAIRIESDLSLTVQKENGEIVTLSSADVSIRIKKGV